MVEPAFVYPANIPVSAAGVYDLLQRFWGVGVWDECLAESGVGGEWWEARLVQCGVVSRSLKARGVDVRDVGLAVVYCRWMGFQVSNVAWLYPHVLPARRWWRAQLVAGRVEDELLAAESGLAVEPVVPVDVLRVEGGLF